MSNPEKEPKNRDELPERPLECSECRKKITVRYTKITDSGTTLTSMCSDCPQLEKRLHGDSVERIEVGKQKSTEEGLVCGTCGTSLANVRMGSLLGCSHCYEIFSDVLIEELSKSKKVSGQLIQKKKNMPYHVGRSPGEITELSPTLRLLALNEALTETLDREDYEQAAWLRDQIKELEEQQAKVKKAKEIQKNGK